jgi:transposase InsO family protein
VGCEGVQRNYSAPYNPQQNGVVERRNQTVVGMAQAFLKQRECRLSSGGVSRALKEEMKATFQMSDLGLLSYLGIEVHQGDSGITLR